MIRDYFLRVNLLALLTAPRAGFAGWRGQRTFSGRETPGVTDIFGKSVGPPQVRLRKRERREDPHVTG